MLIHSIPAPTDREQTHFYAIYREHCQKVFNWVKARLKDHQDAEDITMTVFTRLWLLRQTPPENYSAFLGTCARNAIIDAARKRKSRRNYEIEQSYLAAQEPALPFHDPENNINQALAELENLPPKYRNIIMMFYLEGKSIGEIAALLGTHPQAVSNAKHRAIQTMRHRLQSIHALQQ